MITVLTVDAELQHVCAIFREQANRGEITPIERDLLIDGAMLLAMHVDDDLARDGRVGSDSGWPEGTLPKPAGRHERRAVSQTVTPNDRIRPSAGPQIGRRHHRRSLPPLRTRQEATAGP